MFTWIEEIKKVGLKDWLWFVLYLRRDEFNYKLQLAYYINKGKHKNNESLILRCEKLCRARDRAHRIDKALSS